MAYSKETATGWRMEPAASLSVSGSFQDDNLCPSQFPAAHRGFLLLTAELPPHILTCRAPPTPPHSYHPPSLPARLGSRTSPVGWIRGWFPVAVGRNPEVQAEPSQSPPWARHVSDLRPPAAEGHIRLRRNKTLLLDSGQPEQHTGQPAWAQTTQLEYFI